MPDPSTTADERALEALRWASDEFVQTGRPALARRVGRIIALVKSPTKQCSACGRDLLIGLDTFGRDPRLLTGLKSQCRWCSGATQRLTQDVENTRRLKREYMARRRKRERAHG